MEKSKKIENTKIGTVVSSFLNRHCEERNVMKATKQSVKEGKFKK